MAKNKELQNMKEEIASELGVNLKKENLTAKEAGKVGGQMTKELVEQGKKNKR
mgnify:CR=1 FL=1